MQQWKEKHPPSQIIEIHVVIVSVLVVIDALCLEMTCCVFSEDTQCLSALSLKSVGFVF